MSLSGGSLAGGGGGGGASFTPAYYKGKTTGGQGTSAWSSTSFANMIGPSSPLDEWTDIAQVGVTRSGSVFTFAEGGTYIFLASLPQTSSGDKPIYIVTRLQGSINGTLYQRMDYHHTGSTGGGAKSHVDVITVSDGEQVTAQYAGNDTDAGALFGDRADIGGISPSFGTLTFYRIA